MRLHNKVVVITGAAHGIGKAYARRFAEEGAQVVVADIDSQGGRTVAQALTDLGFCAWARATDVTDYLECPRFDAGDGRKVRRHRCAAQQRGDLRHAKTLERTGRRS